MVSETTLRQDVWESVYDVLNAISYNTSGLVTVTAAYIDKEEQLPQVVINPVDVDYNTFSFGRGSFDNEMRIVVDIYTKQNKDKDIIADDIIYTLNTTSSFTDIHLSNITESNAFETPNAGFKFRLKSIVLTFSRRS